MALRPTSIPRLIFYPPILLLELLTYAICGRVLPLVAHVISRISDAAQGHVYRVLVIARRWTQSEPLWKAEDILTASIVFQPFTAAQRAAAKADPRLRHITCPCGEKSCRFPHGTFVPNMVIPFGSIQELVRAELQRANPGVTVENVSAEAESKSDSKE